MRDAFAVTESGDHWRALQEPAVARSDSSTKVDLFVNKCSRDIPYKTMLAVSTYRIPGSGSKNSASNFSPSLCMMHDDRMDAEYNVGTSHLFKLFRARVFDCGRYFTTLFERGHNRAE